MAQLREVTEQLTAVDRRAGKPKADPVNFAKMLSDALATASPAACQDGIATSEAEDSMVEGPANDLRDLVSSLLEYALTVGRDPVDLRTQVKQTSPQSRVMYATELVIQSPDVPDFLRRKLWDTVRVRRGEVSVISEPDRCRIEFALPIERRSVSQS